MAEKIFPDSNSKPLKPTTVKPAVATATATAKPQLYNAPRPLYRPHPHRSHRSSYCYFYSCLWIIFILLLLTVSAAVAGGVLFLLYRPHRPSFSISDLQIYRFNLTSSDKLTDFRFNLTVTARNPNENIDFNYDAVSISIFSGKTVAGDGTIPAFATARKSSARLKTSVRVDDDYDDNGGFRSDLKEKKRRLGLTIELDSKVKVKIGRRVSENAPIRVVCGGIKAVAPAAGGSPTTAVVSDAKCKVDFRIKIWKWTIWR